MELWDHGHPEDSARNDALAALAARHRLPTVATTNAHYATPDRRRLATALAAVRARRSLDALDGWLPAAGTAHLRSGAEMAALFARYPGAVARAAALGKECAFDLALIRPRLPDFPVPHGHTAMSWLRELTLRGAAERYGPRDAERQPGAYAQLDHELEMIDQLDFPGYFLIVHEIVEFCREQDILCQGRGSAANSAVCYALGITAVDAVLYGLLFERFLSPERNEPPDIDIDIESGRREEVIQHVYQRYGRRHAAQVANVISYRPRSAVRDMAKALGYSTGAQDAWSKQIHRYSSAAEATDHDVPAEVVALAGEVANFPRHLGIHSGGMVICDRPVVEVCPVEWARMADRTVLQWDKDDCASEKVNLVKFDLLGLGMLSALHGCFDFVRDVHGTTWTLATLPKEDPEVYEMLQRADSVGVFQVESRAQMATLPRLKPRNFYDLVVEIAMIRPGPIQGGSVHPYIRRRNGREPIRYPHPSLENCLRRTLGVPMFQEQLMQMVVAAAGCTPAQADKVRRAVGSKRSAERIAELRAELYKGMAEKNGITGETADEIFNLVAAFANFGFAESHSISFALLVYASSWLKLRYPAAFCAALLNAQPMGFYSPQTLVADARRHGVEVLRPDVNLSAAGATLAPAGPGDTEPATIVGPSCDPAGHLLGAFDRRRPGRAGGRGSSVHRPDRRRAADRRDHSPDRGPGHCGGVRQLRPHSPGGAVGGRRGDSGEPGPARRHGAGGGGPAPAGDGRRRADDGRPVGDRHLPGQPPDGPRPAVARPRGRDDRRSGGGARPVPHPGRRGGDTSSATADGGRHDLSQPGRRDGDPERHLLARGCGSATSGWRATRPRWSSGGCWNGRTG